MRRGEAVATTCGYLTRAEISVATREPFTSTDPQAAGSHLYGPLA